MFCLFFVYSCFVCIFANEKKKFLCQEMHRLIKMNWIKSNILCTCEFLLFWDYVCRRMFTLTHKHEKLTHITTYKDCTINKYFLEKHICLLFIYIMYNWQQYILHLYNFLYKTVQIYSFTYSLLYVKEHALPYPQTSVLGQRSPGPRPLPQFLRNVVVK